MITQEEKLYNNVYSKSTGYEEFDREKTGEQAKRVHKGGSMDKGAMERDWDTRARKDAIRYIANEYRGDAFFEEGTKQAYQFCTSFFH